MISKKRFVILMPAFYEQLVGGAEYQAYLLAEKARQRNHEVHYIFIYNQKSVENRLGLNLHQISPLPFTRKKILGSTWSFYFPRVLGLLKKIKPHVVYGRGGWSFAGMAVYYALKHQCISIWHVASSRDVTPPSIFSLLRRPLDLIEYLFVRYAIHHATYVVAQAHYQADLLAKYYGRKAKVIFNSQPEPQERIDKKGPFTIVWVANIKPLKQPEVFIQLAKKFSDKKDINFLMIGRPSKGRYQRTLEQQINAVSNLTYIGEQPIDSVNRILANSHIFVNTSLYEGEGFPNTFIQAWMREVPVVSMLVNPDNILTTQKLGFFSGSFEQMVRDVSILIENPILREQIGCQARRYALENHSIEKNFGYLLDLMGL